MNEEGTRQELKRLKSARAQELKRLKSYRFALRTGLFFGSVMTIITLGQSFVLPHVEFIITVLVWPLIGLGVIYASYIIYKLGQIDKVLKSSGVKTQ